MIRIGKLLAALLVVGAQRGLAQRPVTRAEAVDNALSRGPRLAAARADTSLAAAQLLSARLLPDPAVAFSYSKSRPLYHVTVDLPFDFLGIRSARTGSAEASRRAAKLRFALERASVALDADTTYTKAQAAIAHSRLSTSSAVDAERLRSIAVQRRDAGDASELDVQLATVNAGQELSIAASDSLSVVAALLDLQSVMGLPSNGVQITPADSLVAPPASAFASAMPDGSFSVTIPVAAATEDVNAARLGLRVQHKSVLSPFGINAGFETGGAADEPGILPTVGLTIPIPFLNRNRGGVAEAQAGLARARAQLDLARLESDVSIAQARRTQLMQQSRMERDRILVAAANRVAAMSLTSFREGAAPLASVLEARRTSRDVLARYIDDTAEAWITLARLRVLTLTESSAR
jgi:cobalt-zinc-cadmium efflux system outer membrane protein